MRIFRYVRPYWRRLGLGYIALFSALALQLTIPQVLARVVDRGLSSGDSAYLARAAGLIVLLSAFQGLFTFARSYFIMFIAEGVAYDLRNQLYGRLQGLSFAYYDQAQTGQLMSRVTDDVNNIRGMLMMTLRALVVSIAMLLGVTFILVRLDWQLALVALLVMPPLIWWSLRFGVIIRPLFLRVQQQFGTVTSVLQENIAGARVVRAFAQEARESARFESELSELFTRNITTARKWSVSYALMLLLSGLSLATILWYGGYRVIQGAMTVGTLVAFNRYVTMLADPVRWLGFIVNRIARAIASGERIFEVLDTKPAITERPGALELRPIAGTVTFNNVRFSYAGARREALRGVSFTARPGARVALLGPTGSGKSTVVSLLPRFYDVSGGSIEIDGHDIRDLTLGSLRGQIGAVSQETFLFSSTVAENIAYGRPDASRTDVIAAASAARAHDFISAMPDGYDSVVGERGVTLSGGQKQRIAIARAMLMNPRILILDDATSSVDSETEFHIQQALETLMQGRTSFVIAQRLSTTKQADLILVLDRGEIIERGTHFELLARGGHYAHIYDVQLRDQEDVLQATRAD